MFNRSLSNTVSKDRNTEPKAVILNERETMPMASGSCNMCGACAENCPTKAIRITDRWTVDLGKCIFCMDCSMVCPGNMISEVAAPDYALTREELIVDRDTVIENMERKLDEGTRRMFGRSVALRELDTGSCNACEVDLNCMSNQFYDMHRFGIKVVASPRHADGLIVTGPMANNMKEAAERTYGATPAPKLVIASGACAISGGMFVKGDVFGEGISSVLEPSIFIPGCPPTPDRVIRTLVTALGLH